MHRNPNRHDEMPVGVVIRRTPGVTRWAKWAWKVVALLPGAAAADWKELRRDGDAVEYHAATLRLELHGADAEAYKHGLTAAEPGIYVVLRRTEDAERPLRVVVVTASPYEAQDYMDNGEDIVEKVPMPEALGAWVYDFTQAHFEEEEFVKRRRDKKRVDAVEDGKGDARIRQTADVFRSPTGARREGQS